MTDLITSATVTRTLLGLSNLNINDHVNYTLTDTIMGGTVTWERNTASSPYVDGDITVSRRRPNVQEQLRIYVMGDNQNMLQQNLSTLIQAFIQDTYTLQIAPGNQAYAWQCEAADYTIAWSNVHFVAKKLEVTFSIPRRPVMTAGGF